MIYDVSIFDQFFDISTGLAPEVISSLMVVGIILILAAIITPTADAFTLLIVSLPIWLLYELSVIVVRRTCRDGKS